MDCVIKRKQKQKQNIFDFVTTFVLKTQNRASLLGS